MEQGGRKNVTLASACSGADGEFIGLSSLVKTMHFQSIVVEFKIIAAFIYYVLIVFHAQW